MAFNENNYKVIKMRKLTLLTILFTISSISFAQRGNWQGGGKGRQMDPSKAPKIGQVYGTVVDSVTSEPIPYASISIINSRSNTILTGGISDARGIFHIKEIALGRHKVIVEYIGYEKKELGPYTFLPFGKNNQTEYNLEKIPLKCINKHLLYWYNVPQRGGNNSKL